MNSQVRKGAVTGTAARALFLELLHVSRCGEEGEWDWGSVYFDDLSVQNRPFKERHRSISRFPCSNIRKTNPIFYRCPPFSGQNRCCAAFWGLREDQQSEIVENPTFPRTKKKTWTVVSFLRKTCSGGERERSPLDRNDQGSMPVRCDSDSRKSSGYTLWHTQHNQSRKGSCG